MISLLIIWLSLICVFVQVRLKLSCRSSVRITGSSSLWLGSLRCRMNWSSTKQRSPSCSNRGYESSYLTGSTALSQQPPIHFSDSGLMSQRLWVTECICITNTDQQTSGTRQNASSSTALMEQQRDWIFSPSFCQEFLFCVNELKNILFQ